MALVHWLSSPGARVGQTDADVVAVVVVVEVGSKHSKRLNGAFYLASILMALISMNFDASLHDCIASNISANNSIIENNSTITTTKTSGLNLATGDNTLHGEELDDSQTITDLGNKQNDLSDNVISSSEIFDLSPPDATTPTKDGSDMAPTNSKSDYPAPINTTMNIMGSLGAIKDNEMANDANYRLGTSTFDTSNDQQQEASQLATVSSQEQSLARQSSRLVLQLLILGLIALVSCSLIIIYSVKFCICKRRRKRHSNLRRALVGNYSQLLLANQGQSFNNCLQHHDTVLSQPSLANQHLQSQHHCLNIAERLECMVGGHQVYQEEQLNHLLSQLIGQCAACYAQQLTALIGGPNQANPINSVFGSDSGASSVSSPSNWSLTNPMVERPNNSSNHDNSIGLLQTSASRMSPPMLDGQPSHDGTNNEPRARNSIWATSSSGSMCQSVSSSASGHIVQQQEAAAVAASRDLDDASGWTPVVGLGSVRSVSSISVPPNASIINCLRPSQRRQLEMATMSSCNCQPTMVAANHDRPPPPAYADLFGLGSLEVQRDSTTSTSLPNQSIVAHVERPISRAFLVDETNTMDNFPAQQQYSSTDQSGPLMSRDSQQAEPAPNETRDISDTIVRLVGSQSSSSSSSSSCSSQLSSFSAGGSQQSFGSHREPSGQQQLSLNLVRSVASDTNNTSNARDQQQHKKTSLLVKLNLNKTRLLSASDLMLLSKLIDVPIIVQQQQQQQQQQSPMGSLQASQETPRQSTCAKTTTSTNQLGVSRAPPLVYSEAASAAAEAIATTTTLPTDNQIIGPPIDGEQPADAGH